LLKIVPDRMLLPQLLVRNGQPVTKDVHPPMGRGK